MKANYVIGTPGHEPRLIIAGTPQEAQSHVGAGEVCVYVDSPPVNRSQISADGLSVVDYEFSLEEMKINWITYLRRVYGKAMALGCWTPKGQINSDETSQARLAAYAARAARDSEFTLLYTLLDNTEVEVDSSEIQAMHDALTDYVDAVHRHYRDVKAQIVAADSKEALEAVDPTENWPDTDVPVPH